MLFNPSALHLYFTQHISIRVCVLLVSKIGQLFNSPSPSVLTSYVHAP